MNRKKLLVASFLTILVAGLGFGVRSGLLGVWASKFSLTQTELGVITGLGFAGFGAVILVASLFLDKFGYKPFLLIAGVLHVVSVILTCAATWVFDAQVEADPDAARAAAVFCLKWGVFIFAVANGICEAVINPLIATIYSKEKTHYLNILHAGWPAGICLGAVLGFFMIPGVDWRIVLSLYLIPTVIYLLMIAKEKFPVSEASAAGVTFGEMLKEFLAPVLLLLLFLHACVGYVELGTDSWIGNIMNIALPGKGLLILLYTSALMFVLRFFAGPIVHRINPLGLLFTCAVLAVIGLVALGSVSGAVMIMIAATIYGLGKTFFWPTMLAVVSERFPRGGALTLGAIGGVGMLSAGLLGGPGLGYTQDRYAGQNLQETDSALYEEYKAPEANGFLFFSEVQGLNGAMAGPILAKAQDPEATLTEEEQKIKDAALHGGRSALIVTAGVPAVMALGYLLLLLYFKSQGGYKAIHLAEGGREEED